MEKYFILTVALGSIIWRADGRQQILTGVPSNALELWENGSRTLLLKKDGAELLQDYSIKKLSEIYEVRKPIKNKFELKILENLIKAKTSKKVES